jgi:hypothetical protein
VPTWMTVFMPMTMWNRKWQWNSSILESKNRLVSNDKEEATWSFMFCSKYLHLWAGHSFLDIGTNNSQWGHRDSSEIKFPLSNSFTDQSPSEKLPVAQSLQKFLAAIVPKGSLYMWFVVLITVVMMNSVHLEHNTMWFI